MSERFAVAVIGAGAAGLMAAIRAAERGRRVIVLEKNRKAGVKILMSGGTRCNLTHATDVRGIITAFGPNGRFLHSALAAFGPDDAVELFEAEGVATKVEDTGKIFPASDKALDVLNALLRRLARSGAELLLGEAVTGLRFDGGHFELATPARTLAAERVILTTGGQSYPGSGTTGDGYRFAAQFGHSIVRPRPALVPVTTDAAWATGLRGVTLPDVAVRVSDNGVTLATRRSSLLFAHFGLTGPAALDVSRAVSGHINAKRLALTIDLLPDVKAAAIDEWLRGESLASGKKTLANVMATRLPHRVAEAALTLAGEATDRKATALNREARAKLVGLMKALPVPVRGTLGFEKAEVTAGGVTLDEVDSRTMQSRLRPGLYLAGEVLDLDGLIGGYNFQAAWSTGWLAGSSV